MFSWIRKKPGKTSPALGSLPNGKPVILYHVLSGNSRELEAFPDVGGISKPARQLMGKPPETTHFTRGRRRAATCGFSTSMKAARVDSLAIVAGGLRAKGRLNFKMGVFGDIEPPKALAVPFGTKTKTQSPEFEKRGVRTIPWTNLSG